MGASHQSEPDTQGVNEEEEQQASSRPPVYRAILFSKISGVFHCIKRAKRNEGDEYVLAWNRFASAGMLYSALPPEEAILNRRRRVRRHQQPQLPTIHDGPEDDFV